jgi:hypothetical protein
MPIATFDSEVYGNYYLAQFMDIMTGEVQAFEMFDSQAFDVDAVKEILATTEIVTFNGNHFDLPLLAIALAGGKTKQIKEACDCIIIGGLMQWDICRRADVDIPKCRHIDLIEVAPGFSSLKIYGGRMHTPLIQDLPIAPDALITASDRPKLREYCVNDLRITADLFAVLEPQIDLRRAMSKQYNIDLCSKSDAQIAEAVITREVEKKRKSKVIKPTINPGTAFSYRTPDWIQFSTVPLRTLLDKIKVAQFKVAAGGGIAMPECLAGCTVPIGNSIYRLGIGGLHSSETCAVHVADADHVLLDRDVASYYPAIILRCGLAPTQMGNDFLEVYRSIVERRLVAKAAGDMVTADVLKICVNGSFGKLGSRYSALYAPDLLIQVTVTGQLALLMLIEELESNDIPVVSANTDGIVIKCPVEKHALAEYLIWDWELATGFTTEEARYTALYSRDVNNYIALKADGKAKLKGAYAGGGLAKNPGAQICVDAVLAYLAKDTPIEQTVRGCQDIRRFITVRQVKGGAIKDDTYLGRAVRWYYSIGETGTINYKDNGNTVAKSTGGRPCQMLPDGIPTDLDHDYYIAETFDMLKQLGLERDFQTTDSRRTAHALSV